MNNASWSQDELKILKHELYQKPPKETLFAWASRMVKEGVFDSSRSLHSIRIKAKEFLAPEEDRVAKVVCLDIETSPMEVYVWSLKYNNYISYENIKKEWSMLCWSAKWLFDPKTFGEKVTVEEAFERKDDSILEGIWNVLDKADVVIVHNGKKFDLPKLNARFIKAGYPPPSKYQIVDTKEIAAKVFGFSSNRLDYLAEYFGVEGKSDMEFKDWLNCISGFKSAFSALWKMLDYNMKDVSILEEVYVKMRPWIPNHPNLNLFYSGINVEICPNCSGEISWCGTYATPITLYQGFRCDHCGAVGRSRKKLQTAKVKT